MGFNFKINGLTSKDVEKEMNQGDLNDNDENLNPSYLVDGDRVINIIPSLTSNSDKGFTVSSNMIPGEDYPLYHMFDHNTATLAAWIGLTKDTPISVTVECDKKYIIDKYSLSGSTNDTFGPCAWDFLASNDNIYWTKLDICSLSRFDSKTSIMRHIAPIEGFKYYKVIFRDGGQNTHLHMKDLQLYSLKSRLLDGGLKSILPKMTSATTPAGYKVTSSSFYELSPPYQAFIKNEIEGYRWLSGIFNDPDTYPQWIQIELPEARQINHYKVVQVWFEGYSSIEQARNVKSFQMQGSMDGENWETFDTVTNLPAVTFYNRNILRTLKTPVKYKFYRCSVTERLGTTATGVHLSHIDFYE